MSRSKTERVAVHVSRQGGIRCAESHQRGNDIDIVVSDALVRYWIIERIPGLANLAELELYAAEQFGQIFGDDPAGWVIRIDSVPFAKRWLACALPIGIASDLPRELHEQGRQVVSLQPHFVREYNRHCHALETSTAFCVAEEESTTIGLLVDGEWRGIRIHPPLDSAKADLDDYLRRDCLQCGIDAGTLKPCVVGSLREVAS